MSAQAYDDYVRIFDTTLRDGEQAPGFGMTIDEKVRLGRQLERLGVDVIEAGFPAASEGDFEAVRKVASEIRTPIVCGLARANEADIDRAIAAVEKAARPGLHTFIATSDIHLKHKLKMSRAEVVAAAVKAVERARRHVPHVEFSAEDATRSDVDFLVEVFSAAIEAGANVINVPDTVGYAIPHVYAELIQALRSRVKGIEKAVISAHCHDDLGLAASNSLAGVVAGVRQVECTINGIGERAGNTSMEEVVMALRTRKDVFGVETRIQTEQIYSSSRLLTQITGVAVPPNKAIVGANAFAHEAGIHQDGVLKEKLTYEIMTPQSVGVPTNRLVLGKHSGRHAFRERLRELGYADLSEAELEAAFRRFKTLGDRKKEVYDEDLEAIVHEEGADRRAEQYRLISLSVMSGSDAIPTAAVRIEIGGVLKSDSGIGDGPVDAVFQTIARVVGTEAKLVNYAVNAITGGTDAQGEVSVRLAMDGITVSGDAADPDIILASARAYVNALNRLEERRSRATQARTVGP
ncbi:MAG: 2-isopropylmalate synthase [Deltaproteobacteria bacterium]|nr:2-isopropylmalate synthase [Deltaproteobacteria bacterium]